MKKAIIAMAAALLLACSTTPRGYTPEAWERVKRQDPNFAQTMEWIEESRERSQARVIYLTMMNRPMMLLDRYCVGFAEPEMLQGKPGAFKAAIRQAAESYAAGINAEPALQARAQVALKELDAL